MFDFLKNPIIEPDSKTMWGLSIVGLVLLIYSLL
jgi:hypothetical protein